MYRLLLLGTAAALTAVTSPAIPAANPNPRTACELLSAAEVAQFLGAPSVRIDSINSGNNQLTQVDFCSWYVKEGQSEGLQVKLRRRPSRDEAPVAMIAARVDDGFSDQRPAEAIPGIGEEAQYLGYPDGQGGTIIVRQGTSVVTLTGSPAKATLVAMAKLVAPRL